MKNTSPEPPEHPTPSFVVETHRSVLRRIVTALLAGTKHARWYADTMDEPLDSGIAPALVRKGAKRDLMTDTNIVAKDEEDTDYAPEFLANLGLAITAEGIRFRVLRSAKGDVPVPGQSKARQAFYRQEVYLAGIDPTMMIPMPSAITHVVLHWDTDEEYNLSRVYLALPLAGNTTRESVLVLWNEIVWRRQAPAVDGKQVEAVVTDFDIYIEDEKRG